MSITKPTKKKRVPMAASDQPQLPNLGDIGDIDLPDLPGGDMALPDLDAIMNGPAPGLLEMADYSEDGNFEKDGEAEAKLIDDEFAAVRQGRKEQQQAIEIANDSEFWFAVYFQTREQKEHFLAAMEWLRHGDKYIDGQWVAKKQGIELPVRPAKYKVGRLDKTLTDLT